MPPQSPIAFEIARRTNLMTSPTVPEKAGSARARSDGFGTVTPTALRVVCRLDRSSRPELRAVGRRGVRAPHGARTLSHRPASRSSARCSSRRRGTSAWRGRPAALGGADPCRAEVAPDGVHLRDVRHRDAAGARRAEGPELRVLDLLAGVEVRRDSGCSRGRARAAGPTASCSWRRGPWRGSRRCGSPRTS